MVDKIIKLWHETQVGHYKKCREKQIEFSEMMWELYEESGMAGPVHSVSTKDKRVERKD